ncbi:exported hypothetical protein [Vibrio crassostreae]|nr:hypothetical protein EDB37_102610 [Vibrio crassostreae]CAK2459968.1 exported hypothetical protein [Vibrio crassostreae]CAK2466779.1 exported hypothetical protein [Vibrio crassostreae]CAK3758549.1 exported hypothetical protein [Vibrio crassostreae]CAK3900956.1 exported hypothetical protein [Vibrio crassostreae]
MKLTPVVAAVIMSFSSASFAFSLQQSANENSEDLVWTGHLSPDSDTVMSAMLAAHIYGGRRLCLSLSTLNRRLS